MSDLRMLFGAAMYVISGLFFVVHHSRMPYGETKSTLNMKNTVTSILGICGFISIIVGTYSIIGNPPTGDLSKYFLYVGIMLIPSYMLSYGSFLLVRQSTQIERSIGSNQKNIQTQDSPRMCKGILYVRFSELVSLSAISILLFFDQYCVDTDNYLFTQYFNDQK